MESFKNWGIQTSDGEEMGRSRSFTGKNELPTPAPWPAVEEGWGGVC